MKIKKQIVDLKLSIKYFIIDSYGWFRSMFMVVFKNIKYPGIFYGYASYFWACKYAQRRTKNWKTHWDQMGKEQGIFPFGDVKLICCSKLEMKAFKKARIVNKNFNPRKAIKKAYYKTQIS